LRGGIRDRFFDVGGPRASCSPWFTRIQEITGRRFRAAIFRANDFSVRHRLGKPWDNQPTPSEELQEGEDVRLRHCRPVDLFRAIVAGATWVSDQSVYKVQGSRARTVSRPFTRQELRTLRRNMWRLAICATTRPYCLGGMCGGF